MAAEIEMERRDEISRRRVKCYTRVSRLASRAHQFTRPEKIFLHVHTTHPPTYQKDAATGSCVKSNHICSLNAIPLSSPRRAMAVLELYFFYVYVCIVCLSVFLCVCVCVTACCCVTHDTYDAIAATEKRHFEKGDDDSIATR